MPKKPFQKKPRLWPNMSKNPSAERLPPESVLPPPGPGQGASTLRRSLQRVRFLFL